MTCVPSLSPGMFVEARQILHEFCCYLARLKGQSGDLGWLRKSLAKSNVLFQPVCELPVVSEPYGEREVLAKDA